MKFKITWPDGRTDVEESEALDADAYAMERWGRPSAKEVGALYGVALEEFAEPVSEPAFADTQALADPEEKPAASAKAKKVPK